MAFALLRLLGLPLFFENKLAYGNQVNHLIFGLQSLLLHNWHLIQHFSDISIWEHAEEMLPLFLVSIQVVTGAEKTEMSRLSRIIIRREQRNWEQRWKIKGRDEKEDLECQGVKRSGSLNLNHPHDFRSCYLQVSFASTIFILSRRRNFYHKNTSIMIFFF